MEVFLFPLGSLFLTLALVTGFLHYSKTKWAVAEGVITEAVLQTRNTIDQKTRSRSTFYDPVISYAYEVSGQRYAKNHRMPGVFVSFGSREKADAYMARFRKGMRTTVHYPAGNPGNGIIDIGSYVKFKVFSIISATLYALGLIAMALT
jgi:hypothetical protein